LLKIIGFFTPDGNDDFVGGILERFDPGKFPQKMHSPLNASFLLLEIPKKCKGKITEL